MDDDLEFNMEVVEELAYAVVGCVYDSDQQSVLVYNSQLAKDVLMSHRMRTKLLSTSKASAKAIAVCGCIPSRSWTSNGSQSHHPSLTEVGALMSFGKIKRNMDKWFSDWCGCALTGTANCAARTSQRRSKDCNVAIC